MQNAILSEALGRLVKQIDLTTDEARAVLDEIMEGRAGDAQTAAVLTALRTKGETAAEIVGFAQAMSSRVERVEIDADVILDTCGTGGDQLGTFNISTVAAFVVAAAGVLVAKHGNRSATSKCGSADLLEALGARIDLAPGAVERCLEEVGIGFMFAPLHHQSMARVAPLRRELGVRTIFNIVGPLTNPAGARHQLIGVSDPAHVQPMAQAVRMLGSARNLVVHATDGLDEMSISASTQVIEVFADRGFDRRFLLTPEDVGLRRGDLTALRGGDARQNAEIAHDVLAGTPGPRLDVVLLNAGAALYIAEAAPSIAAGVEMAREQVKSGAARAKLAAFVAATHGPRLAAAQ